MYFYVLFKDTVYDHDKNYIQSCTYFKTQYCSRRHNSRCTVYLTVWRKIRFKRDIYFCNIISLFSRIIRIPGFSSHLYLIINWRAVQRKTVLNNVDMSSLRASWHNGPYKIQHVEHHYATYIQKQTINCVVRMFYFYLHWP